MFILPPLARLSQYLIAVLSSAGLSPLARWIGQHPLDVSQFPVSTLC